MGLFLSLSGVIGRTKDEVLTSLTNYANSVDGGLSEENLTTDNEHCCVIEEINGNTTILYPNGYIEWDASSEFISKELMTSVFSFHIHDGDLWMYILYANGIVIDQFNPIPDYWTDEISENEIQSWKGDASIITKQIPNLESKDIEKYLVRWDFDNEDEEKAYPTDEFIKEDWQLVDFMRKVGFSHIHLTTTGMSRDRLSNYGQKNYV